LSIELVLLILLLSLGEELHRLPRAPVLLSFAIENAVQKKALGAIVLVLLDHVQEDGEEEQKASDDDEDVGLRERAVVVLPGDFEVIGGVSQVVVKGLARLVVLKYLVRLGNLAENHRRICSLVLVRVVHGCQSPIRTLKLPSRGGLLYSKHIVARLLPTKHPKWVVDLPRCKHTRYPETQQKAPRCGTRAPWLRGGHARHWQKRCFRPRLRFR